MIKDRDTFDGTTIPAPKPTTQDRAFSQVIGAFIGLAIGIPLGVWIWRVWL